MFCLLTLPAACRNVGSGADEADVETVFAADLKWSSSTISTCWEFTSSETDGFRKRVQSTVEKAFQPTKVRLTGWQKCPSDLKKIDIRIFIYDDSGSKGNADYQALRSKIARESAKGHPRVRAFGQKLRGMTAGVVLSTKGEDAHPFFIQEIKSFSDSGRMNFIVSASLHEFGHAIGLYHEDAHPDNQCTSFDEGLPPRARVIGPWNKTSFMERCFYRNFDYNKGIVWPNKLDIDGINKAYSR